MKKFSQKPTSSEVKTDGREKSSTVHHKNGSTWVRRQASSGRFAGMAKDLERVAPLHIAGYKSRG